MFELSRCTNFHLIPTLLISLLELVSNSFAGSAWTVLEGEAGPATQGGQQKVVQAGMNPWVSCCTEETNFFS